MANIQINGVGFNTDAVLKKTKEEFFTWNFFDECWPHLKKEDKQAAIEQAWNVINEINALNANDNRNAREVTEPVEHVATDSGGKRRRNERKLPE